MTWKPASWRTLIERLSQVTSASVNPNIGAPVIYTLQAKMGELLENAHGLKDGQLVLKQENILELVVACIETDRKELTREDAEKFAVLREAEWIDGWSNDGSNTGTNGKAIDPDKMLKIHLRVGNRQTTIYALNLNEAVERAIEWKKQVVQGDQDESKTVERPQ